MNWKDDERIKSGTKTAFTDFLQEMPALMNLRFLRTVQQTESIEVLDNEEKFQTKLVFPWKIKELSKSVAYPQGINVHTEMWLQKQLVL